MRSSRPGAAHSGVCFRLYGAAGLRAFRGAKPLRRLPLHRGRAESEARFYLRLPLRAAAALFARRGFAPRAPPYRRDHRAERGRRVAVLEGLELAVDVRGGPVKAPGQSRGLEARRDLLHLADPAPGLARLDGDDLGALLQLGLRELPLGEQGRVHALDFGQRADRGKERGRALGPAGVAGFERRGRARRSLQRNGVQIAAREERGDLVRPRTGQIHSRAPAFDGRRTDDAAVDEARARLLDRAADLARALRRDRVGVDVDSAESEACDLAGERELGARAGQCPGVMIWIWWRLTLRKGALMSLRSPISHTSASVTAIKSFASTM